MRLTYWTKGNIARVYAGAVEGCSGKVYFQLSRGKLEVVADDFYIEPAMVLEATIAWLGLPLDTPGAAAFEALRARAQTPRPSQPREHAAPAPARPIVSLKQGESGIPNHRFGMAELAFENIRNAEPIDIEIDHREPEAIGEYLKLVPNARIQRVALEVADFRLNGRILVERKAAMDFKNSVEDARLFDQAQRIGFSDDTVGIVLIEGDVFGIDTGMLFSSITGAISCLSMVQGLSVWQTLDIKHTAYALAKLAQHDRNGLGYELPLRKEKPKRLLDAASYVLEGINGVNAGLAKTLLAHFGSVRAVANASLKDLMAVKGVGPKTAANIVEVLAAGDAR